MRVAVLEDDPIHADLVRTVVTAMGHDCILFDNGRQMLEDMRIENFDLLVLDWGVPEASGYEVVEWVRSNVRYHVPVLFVTGHAREHDIVAALMAGADDYMVKPVRIPEMLARIAALLRRSYPQTQSSVTVFGRYTFDAARSVVRFDDQQVELKEKEFRLAYLLFANMGRLLSRNYLLQSVWGMAKPTGSRSLDTHLSRIRTMLQLKPENGLRLSAVYSHGYRLEALGSVTAEAQLAVATESVTKNAPTA